MRRLVPWVGTAGLTIAVLLSVDATGFLPALLTLPPLVFVGACCIALSEELLVGPFKWARVVAAVGPALSFREALLIRLGSQPIRSVAPLKTGEAAAVVYLSRVHDMDVATATSTVLFEKAVNLWATVFLISVGLSLAGVELAPVLVVAWLVLPFLRGPWRALADALRGRFGRVGPFAAGLLDAFLSLPPRELAMQLPLAVLFTGLEVVNSWWLLTVLMVDVSFATVLVVVPISYFLNNVPVTVLGIGMREGLFVVALAGLAAPATLFAAGVAVSIVEYVVPTLVGLLALPRFLSAVAQR